MATVTVLLSGCHHFVQGDTPCPARPLLEPITAQEQVLIAPGTLSKIASNQIKLKQYAKKLEARANCDT
jgi:hypothetical protein